MAKPRNIKPSNQVPLAMMAVNIHLTMSTDGIDSLAAADVSDASGNGWLMRTTGRAIRHPDDPHNPRRGMYIASARALRDLADQFEKNAHQTMPGDPLTSEQVQDMLTAELEGKHWSPDLGIHTHNEAMDKLMDDLGLTADPPKEPEG